ncbi:DUF6351 family protein [Amycolatopsis sp. SID8362]|uniref:DUF6351 family protein n=1 Tax=Amycolatopsis sp. SID8362 TaxID=2690346 RepID=UPI0013692ED7|nr:DUF6351 family protein [Amycolatopsis sp. SID8362]NBH09022.1 hypothetical protein [Amycolatopsis sp. SID8362]NED45714.1 hypothetical protein [Amycolatopsis sp. SID8362]
MANRAFAVAALVAPLLLTGTAAAVAAPGTPPGRRLTIETVSNPQPALVSGEQVLVKVVPPERARVTVRANGRDVTASFRAQPDGSLLGLVTGLREGTNDLSARTSGPGPDQRANLRVTDHPISGPVFSGAQQHPFYCETQAFGLPAAQQPLCSAPTQVSYQYRTTAGAFAPLADPASRPADLATATVDGHAVPYVVRVERGTIDRAVYEMAALYTGTPSPTAPDPGWNGKLVYTFGGGCNGGYHQGASTGGVVNDLFLGRGFAVASSSLNVLDTNCSPIISAEAAMMVKEHFAETYGPIAHTIGWGGSGGAIQQYDIAENYPGIVDGIIPGVSFPDPLSVGGPVSDCRLLDRYFAGPGAAFTAAQKQAVAGFASYDSCTSWDLTFASRATATGSCNAAIPVAARWDPVTNPGGVKCNSNEQLVNQLGRDPRTGFVRSTLDTTGVQYGLAALKSGTITAAQFADLNASIGGLDYTGTPVAQRTAADPKALDAAYADGIVNSASQGLRETPIIDQRTDLDFAGPGNDIHTTEWSYVLRQRLLRANGTAANQVIIENHATAAEAAAASAYELDAMDRWLTAIDADRSHRSRQQKVLANRPGDLGDGCYLSASSRVTEALTYPASGQCGALYPVAANTRMVAGEGLALDVLKCRLKPLDFRDYPVTFTAADQQRLRAAFPGGVCDYRRPGVGQRPPVGTWLDYGDGTTP